MTRIGRQHAVEGFGEGLKVAKKQSTNPTNGWQDKSADRGRAHVVGRVRLFDHCGSLPCRRFSPIPQPFQYPERHRPCCAAGAPR
jgi:hypothetical protein